MLAPENIRQRLLLFQGGDEIYHMRTFAGIVTVPDPEILQVSTIFWALETASGFCTART